MKTLISFLRSPKVFINALALLGFVLLASVLVSANKEKAPPNIIIILADDAGYAILVLWEARIFKLLT
jgi:hypothetical protein